jgi:hypothetical protein
MSAAVMTPTQARAFGEYARDGVEGYAPANDDRSEMMRAAVRRGWREMAERLAQRGPEWQFAAYAAAEMAQRS